MSKAEQLRRTTTVDTVVAEWAGLTLHALHVLHPVDFGSPRHFRWDGIHYCYTAAGLRALASALREAGQGLAAGRIQPLIDQAEQNESSPAADLGLRHCA